LPRPCHIAILPGHFIEVTTTALALETLVSDIFREVDEEVRRERLEQLWTRYRFVLIALAAAVVLGVGGWRGYQWWEAKRAAEAGAQFEAAVALAEQGKSEEAQAAFDKVARTGTSGYSILARFRAAEELAQRDPQAALKDYDALTSDPGIDETLRDLAAVRAGLIRVDTASYPELSARLEPLTAANRAFRHTARELLALSAWRAGDQTAVKRWVDVIMADATTPAAVRARADMLTVTSGSEKG
jgi:hypothetical protein